MSDLGYVVIEFNQASGQPEIAPAAPYLFDTKEDARDKSEALILETYHLGRRERYAVASVTIEEES